MRHDWSALGKAELNLCEYEWGEILIDFNGPQVATLSCDQQVFLGVASDDEGDTVRWILAPVTSRELAALSHGLLGTKDAFKKSTLRVLDLDLGTEHFASGWSDVDVDAIDDAALPAPEAKLDRFMTPRSLEDGERCFVIDSPEMGTEGIDFKTLSNVLKNAQRVWSSIAQVIEDEPTARGTLPRELRRKSELRTRALRAGSVVIDISQTEHEALHDRIAESFADLIDARDDSNKLSELFGVLKTRARSTYTDFLKSIAAGGVEFQMSYQSHQCYTNAALASRARHQIESPSLVREESDVLELTGTFTAFDLDGTFTFYDSVNEEMLQGTVPGDAQVVLPIEVGTESMYTVMVETSLSRQLSGETRQHNILLEAKRQPE